MNRKTVDTAFMTLLMIFISIPLALPAGAGEPLQVTLNKTTVLRLASNASTVTVGEPAVAAISVESPRLIFIVGKEAGETNLLILNANNEELYNFDVVVVPEGQRHITVHRGSSELTTYNCSPRCTPVKTPGEPLSGGASAGGGGAGGLLDSLGAQSGTDGSAAAAE